jgi:hypothetical protein
MQQAMTRVEREHPRAADGNATPSALSDSFVINLISSTTPVALKRPDHAGLKRFTFFVSRRREDGRERFRLHMGYFDTQEEAEKLLDIVREIYPGAWAGLAPGRGLRAAAAASANPNDAAASAVAPAAGTLAVKAPAVASITPTAAVVRSNERVPPPPTPAARVRKNAERQTGASSLSDVRAAISSLEDAAARKAAAARARRNTAASPQHPTIPTCMPVAIAPATRSAAPPAPPAARVAPAAPTTRSAPAQPALSEQAVLKLLERSAKAAKTAPATAPREEKPCYAVQLLWSVQPIDVARVPQLAIFSAYTLYGAQGHRDGRRWYGLRLGFFTDAVSAKQVAHYVRADFATVSVVPVSERERDQAKRTVGSSTAASAAGGAGRGVPLNSQGRAAAAAVSLDEFKFIDDSAAAEIKPSRQAQRGAAPAVPGRSPRGAPGKRAVVRPGRVNARSKAKPMTLEETLEILGANSLEVESEARRKDGGSVRPAHAASGKDKPSKLSRLFDRLSERLGS